MQVSYILLSISLATICLSLKNDISLKYSLKLTEYLFYLRISLAFVSVMLSHYLFKNAEIDLYSSIAFFIFLFFLYSKVIIKSLTRGGELVSRFTLDALPIEQYAIDSAKRDSLIDVETAYSETKRQAANTKTLVKLESILKLISSEPFLLIISLALMAVKNFLSASDDIQMLLSSILNFGSIYIISSLGSLHLLYKVVYGVTSKEDTQDEISRIYLFYFIIAAISVSFVVLGFSLINSKLLNGLLDMLPTLILLAVGLAYYYNLPRIKLFKHLDISPYTLSANSEFSTSSGEVKSIQNELLIILNINDNVDELVTALANEVKDKHSLFLSLTNIKICIKEDIKQRNRSYTISLNDKTEIFDYNPRTSNLSKEIIKNIVSNYGESLNNNIKLSDVQGYFKKLSTNNVKYANFKNIELGILDKILKTIQSSHSEGIVVSDLLLLFEIALAEDIEPDEILVEYLSRNSKLLSAADGLCRLMYVDDARNVKPSEINDVILKFEQRRILPLVLVTDDLKMNDLSPDLMGKLITIRKESLPSKLNYFPVR